MKFISTRGKSPAVTAAEAIRRGLAPDGGLYVPDELPVFFAALPVIVCLALIYRRPLEAYDVIYNFLGLSFSFNNEWWFVLPFAVLLVLFPAMKRFAERLSGGLCAVS